MLSPYVWTLNLIDPGPGGQNVLAVLDIDTIALNKVLDDFSSFMPPLHGVLAGSDAA